ncbi:MAG: transporter [Nevskiales bacterium]
MKAIAPLLAGLLGLSIACSARADDLRDFCADRPGLGTPSCIVDKSHVMAELGVIDWAHDNTAGVVSDSVTGWQLLLRAGVSSNVELQLGWDGYQSQRTRDASGLVSKVHGGGDALVGLKIGLRHPDGSGTSRSVLPYAKLPVGKAGIGAGDWSAGVIVPVGFALRPGLSLALSPQISAQPNASGEGHHANWGGVAGLGLQLSKHLSAAAELGWLKDEDSDGHSSATTGGLSLAYLATSNLQFDGGVNLRLGGITPDRELYVGVSRRF